MSLRVKLWQLKAPPVKRRHKLWTLRLRLENRFWRGPYETYMRGKFFQRVHGKLPKWPHYYPVRELEEDG